VNERLVYPEIAKSNGVQGRVTLQFTIATDGSVTKVKVVRGVDPSLDQEAIRLVSSSPKWKPGKQRGMVVPVTYTFPVIFQIR
jgi:protein TonB